MIEQQYITSQEKDNKKHILNMLESKEVYVSNLSFDSLTNAISSAKNILNEEISHCVELPQISASNIYEQLILAKGEKIDRLIDLYNQSNTMSSFKFKDDKIIFDSLKKVKKIKFFLDNFNYDYPLSFLLQVTKTNGSIIEEVIVPFDYRGIYSELLDIKEEGNISLAKPSNRNNILFYNCVSTEENYQVGTLLNYKIGEQYSFNKEGYIEIDPKRVSEKMLLLRYHPHSSFFEINVNDVVSEIGIVAINDKMKLSKEIEKRIEVEY